MLSALINILWQVDRSWIVTFFLGGLTYILVQYYVNKKSYPPGPTPLPLVGNLIGLFGKNMSSCKLLHLWPKQFPKVFTMWYGTAPTIVVSNWDLARDALVTQKNAFSGRTQRLSGKLIQGEFSDVIFSDFGPDWVTLRKIGFSAARKFADSERLAVLVSDVVDQCTSIMLKENGPFDPTDHMFLTMYNIIATTAFGRRYEMADPEFVQLKDTAIKINDNIMNLYGDAFPKLRYLFYYQEFRITKLINTVKATITEKYVEHKRTYVSGVVRDFTDALLAAKEEAELESRENLQNMSDGNLKMLLYDLFNAGSDTTRVILMWCFLYLANYPQIQEKLRKEVLESIGERIPVQADKNSCPCLLSFISEVLRVQPVINFTLEHTAIADTQLGEHKINKGTSLMGHVFALHNNPDFWDKPEEFQAERFLKEDGSFNAGRIDAFLPFGIGRRGCMGEKLARADLFLIIACFLQRLRFKLPSGPGTADLESKNLVFVNQPKEYKIVVEKV